MSNVDALVTKGLAAAAAANRARLRTLEDTLHAVAPVQTIAVARTTTHPDLRLLALADVYAGRVARTAAGAAALGCVGAMLLGLVAWSYDLDSDLVALFVGSPLDLAPRFAILLLCVHIVAGGLARTGFARAVAEDPGRGEALVARSDRWAVALPILGPFVFAMVLGVASITVAYDPVWMFACSLSEHCRGVGFDASIYDDRMRDLAIVVPLAAFIIGVIVARRRTSLAPAPGVLERGRTIALGCAILIATVAVGLRYDDGPWRTDPHGMLASPATTELRTVLTITGAIGLVVTLTSLALWRRRRELARIAPRS